MEFKDRIENPINKIKLFNILDRYSNGEEIYDIITTPDEQEYEDLKEYKRKFNKWILPDSYYGINIKHSTYFWDGVAKKISSAFSNKKKRYEKIKEKFTKENYAGFYVGSTDYADNKNYFCLDIGADTYEFAKKFEEKCIENHMEFLYEVANPYNEDIDECFRSDKLKIYFTEYCKEKYLAYIEEIREDNPRFDYRETPILAGNIDGWIGVEYNEKDESYNSNRARCIEEAIEEVFEGVDRENIYNYAMIYKDSIRRLEKSLESKVPSEKHFWMSNEKKQLDERMNELENNNNEPKEVNNENEFDIYKGNVILDEKDDIIINEEDIDEFEEEIEESEEEIEEPEEEIEESEEEIEESEEEIEESEEEIEESEEEIEESEEEIEESEEEIEESEEKIEEPEEAKTENKELDFTDFEQEVENNSLDKNLLLLKNNIKNIVENGYTLENSEEYRIIIKNLYEQRAKALNLKESKTEKGLNIRRLDSMASNVIISYQKINKQIKLLEIPSATAISEYEFSLKKLNNYFEVKNKEIDDDHIEELYAERDGYGSVEAHLDNKER